MNLIAALIYWVVIAVWVTVLTTLTVLYVRNPRAFGTTRLLLAAIGIDTLRNIAENVYFGLYFGAHYGVFPSAWVEVLGNPYLFILPKLSNVAAGCVVLGLMLGRWLPAAVRERRDLDRTADELRKFAALDAMTGLFNRGRFDALAAAEWDKFQREGRPLSLLIVDIDFFKAINDRHGHDVGDRVIIQVANACRDQKRESAIVARLGGEEFALLLPETGLNAATTLAERLQDVISRHVLALPDEDITFTVSIGISEAAEASSLKDLLKQADIALYDAKREGRDLVRAYNRGAARGAAKAEPPRERMAPSRRSG